LGIFPPDDFIPNAEATGWIDSLTQQILEKAFVAAKSLPGALTLSVNISPVQLQDLELSGRIREIAKRNSFSLDRLIIEVTESALIGNLTIALERVCELQKMGCRISLDDFGTGYSSLFHLRSLPFDELKVDRSFVSSMLENNQSRKIVGAVVALGQSLGMRTIAEGIESQEQAEIMLWLGCKYGQGWFFGKPSPAEGLERAVAKVRQPLTSNAHSPLNRFIDGNLNAPPNSLRRR
jgi:EAL domain-containing protein (putative c-di-GMP-specific phosphodiesterase class I)